MSIQKLIIGADKLTALMNLCLEAKHDKPFNLVSQLLQDIQSSVKVFQESNPPAPTPDTKPLVSVENKNINDKK